MAFRSDEAARNGYERAMGYLVPRDATDEEREQSVKVLAEILEEYGPVIDAYPSWHPLVSNHSEQRYPITAPGRDCGYEGLDHTIYLANGFITCPYGDGQDVIDSVESLPYNSVANISAEQIDAKLYSTSATPILVRCSWNDAPAPDGTIPKSLAVPLLLEVELPCWRDAERAESWQTMRPYFLGRPCGSRSSLSVNQETGQTLKSIWNSLINTGMFGPIKV